jgi:hypothetical protein
MSIRIGHSARLDRRERPLFAGSILAFALALLGPGASGPPDPNAYASDSPHFVPALVGGVLAFLGVLVLIAVRALGWIFSGFAQSNDAGSARWPILK